MTDRGPAAPAGWYAQEGGAQRYWNGSAWMDRVEPGAAAPVAPAPRADASAGEVIASIALPIVGLIWGIAELGKRPRVGWQMMSVSVVAFIVWGIVLRSN